MDLRRFKGAALEGCRNVDGGDRHGWHLWDMDRNWIAIRCGTGDIFRIKLEEAGGERWLYCEMGDRFVDDCPYLMVGSGRGCEADTLEDGVRAMILLVARIFRARERGMRG